MNQGSFAAGVVNASAQIDSVTLLLGAGPFPDAYLAKSSSKRFLNTLRQEGFFGSCVFKKSTLQSLEITLVRQSARGDLAGWFLSEA